MQYSVRNEANGWPVGTETAQLSAQRAAASALARARGCCCCAAGRAGGAIDARGQCFEKNVGRAPAAANSSVSELFQPRRSVRQHSNRTHARAHRHGEAVRKDQG